MAEDVASTDCVYERIHEVVFIKLNLVSNSKTPLPIAKKTPASNPRGRSEETVEKQEYFLSSAIQARRLVEAKAGATRAMRRVVLLDRKKIGMPFD